MRLRGIEASRGIAALIVVASHATRMLSGQHPLGDFFRFGHAGVEFFFVLSGFIIAHVHGDDIGHPQRLGRYAERRLTRVYPTYWAIFLLYAALLTISPDRHGTEMQPWPFVAGFLLLPSVADQVVGVSWTLQHELLFYALFAILLLHRRAGLCVFGIWLVPVAWNTALALARGAVPDRGALPHVLLSPYNLCFFIGIGVAMLARRRRGPPPGMALSAGMMLFLAIALQEWITAAPPQWSWRSLCYGAASGLVVHGLVAAELRGQWRLPAWTNWAGTVSYPLYLSHILVLMLAIAVLKRLGWLEQIPPALTLFCLVAGATMFAAMFHRAIEAPMLRWLRRVLSRRGSRITQPVP